MKFLIRDEDGKQHEIEEILEKEDKTYSEPKPAQTTDEDEHKEIEALNFEEIAALKKLAAMSEKLIALCEDKINDEDIDEDDTDVLDEDYDEDDEDDKMEKVIDTSKARDSKAKKSFGSIENKQKVDDSSNDLEDPIAKAWEQRYNKFGGGK